MNPTDARQNPTEEDELFPVYCIACKAAIPRATSDEYKGLCFNCHLEAAPDTSKGQGTPGHIEAETAKYATNTGLGQCQLCYSKNIRQFDVYDESGKKSGAVAGAAIAAGGASAGGFALGAMAPLLFVGGVLCLVFLPCLVLIAIFALPVLIPIGLAASAGLFGLILYAVKATAKKKVGTSRECMNCGHRWPV